MRQVFPGYRDVFDHNHMKTNPSRAQAISLTFVKAAKAVHEKEGQEEKMMV